MYAPRIIGAVGTIRDCKKKTRTISEKTSSDPAEHRAAGIPASETLQEMNRFFPRKLYELFFTVLYT